VSAQANERAAVLPQLMALPGCRHSGGRLIGRSRSRPRVRGTVPVRGQFASK